MRNVFVCIAHWFPVEFWSSYKLNQMLQACNGADILFSLVSIDKEEEDHSTYGEASVLLYFSQRKLNESSLLLFILRQRPERENP